MNLKIVRWVLLFAAACTLVAQTSAFTQQQLNSVSTLAKDFIRQNIIGRKLKDYTHKYGYVKNIRIADAQLPRLSVSESNNWLYVSASNIGLSVTADYRVKWSWIFRESGSLFASVSDVSFRIPISLNDKTFLQADRSRCTDSVGRIYYKIRGGLLGWLANLFRRLATKWLQRELRGDICKILAKAINKNSAKISGILGK